MLALRYHVRESSLIRWNKLSASSPVLKKHHKLKIYSRHVPPQRTALKAWW